MSISPPTVTIAQPIKLNTLLANLVIFHNAIDIMDVVRSLVAEGWLITAGQLDAMSPYLRAHISRSGAWATDDLARRPEAFNPSSWKSTSPRICRQLRDGGPGSACMAVRGPQLAAKLASDARRSHPMRLPSKGDGLQRSAPTERPTGDSGPLRARCRPQPFRCGC